MNSTKKNARTAGWIYLLLAITGFYSIMYVPGNLVVFGDATATANNIASSELLFRSGIFVGLVSSVIFVVLALALYRLLNQINHRQAILMVTLVAVSAATGFLATLIQMGALIALSGADFLSVFDKPQLDALAYVFLRWESHVVQGVQIFWGLWLFPFGLLVYQSRFIPKIFGVLVMIAGFAYVLSSFMSIVLPQYTSTVSPIISILVLAELPIIFWLLIVGAKDQTEERQSRS